jgi:hypothetical protein
VGNDERSRSQRWLALAMFALSSLMAGCGASGSTARTGHSVISGGKERRTASVKAAERSAGLTVMLTATLTHAKTGSPVEFNLTAYSPHVPGAFGYQLHYGDGTSAENVVPQFCVAGGGTPTRETWHLPIVTRQPVDTVSRRASTSTAPAIMRRLPSQST